MKKPNTFYVYFNEKTEKFFEQRKFDEHPPKFNITTSRTEYIFWVRYEKIVEKFSPRLFNQYRLLGDCQELWQIFYEEMDATYGDSGYNAEKESCIFIDKMKCFLSDFIIEKVV